MDVAVRNMIAERMDKHLEQYILFESLCESKMGIYNADVAMLWETWCIAKATY